MRNAVRCHNELMREYQREVWLCNDQLERLKLRNNNNAGAVRRERCATSCRFVDPRVVDPVLKEAPQ